MINDNDNHKEDHNEIKKSLLISFSGFILFFANKSFKVGMNLKKFFNFYQSNYRYHIVTII